MFRFIAKLFPRRTESMDIFVAFVLDNGCANVEVAPVSNALAQPGVPGVGMFELFSLDIDDIATEYCVRCIAIAPQGERMVYNYTRIVRCVPRRDYPLDDKRYTREIFSAAEQCVALLKKEQIPNVRVELLGTAGVLVM